MFKSRFLICSIVVLLLNGILLYINPIKSDRFSDVSLPHGWAWWAAQNFKSEPVAPDVVLVGSSLLMNPLWSSEAQYLQHDIDIVTTRRLRYLEALLRDTKPLANTICFNLGLPGAMLSDDYMVIRSLLTAYHKPQLIVLGLSPRDFIDNQFRCAATSDHFRYLSTLTDIGDLTELAMPQLWQRGPYYLHQYDYFEKKKSDIHSQLKTNLENLTASLIGQSHLSPAPTEKVDSAIYKSELQKGVWIAHPNVAHYYHETEYAKQKARFGHANPEGCENQRKWLDLCLSLCKEKGIKTIVVNMPITTDNVRLFAPGVYENCINIQANESRKYGCQFINLQNANFEATDFTDLCHMDASGGKKFLDKVAPVIAQNISMEHRAVAN